MLKLSHNLSFQDLYCSAGIGKIDELWLESLKRNSYSLYQALINMRLNHLPIDPKIESQLIIELAGHLEDFISQLFNIDAEVKEVANSYNKLAIIYQCKRQFIQRDAVKNYDESKLLNIATTQAQLEGLGVDLASELSFAQFVEDAKNLSAISCEHHLQLARDYAAWATLTPDGQKKHHMGILYKIPAKIDVNSLLKNFSSDDGEISTSAHSRDGFSFSGASDLSISKAYDQANYCIHCHKQSKDSCSKGMKSSGNGFKYNELNIKLTGCPLEEKISEMNLLKSQGSVIGSIAVAIIDNPMLAATGHRICNDCMKSCIYQKQEPVNIPLIETQTLNDVLNLPWGFEIYSLLAKWNPLNFKNYGVNKNNNYKILIAGLGPAGFSSAHYLTNLGYSVVAIDALKIEPQSTEISGIDINGKRHKFKPIKDVKTELFANLDERQPQGFGGVSEYGITIRWNKNYLNVIRTMLERRENFRMYGSMRFGSNIDYKTAKELGFDHIVLALGAGKPNLPDVPNILAKGCRMASDFLMTLQQGGAFLGASLTNLQIRLPIVVIGGGLTAIDTATESLAYYCVQVEKFLKHYEYIGDVFLQNLSEEERLIADEFLLHAQALRDQPEQKLKLLQSWGGAKVLYRRTIQESPAYRLNHEEVQHALAEGIAFVENITPTEIMLDTFSSAHALKHTSGIIPARAVLIATGTMPNTTLTGEDPVHFKLNGKYFQAYDGLGNPVQPELSPKTLKADIIMNRGQNGPSMTFLGDLHPSFAGNVVKAIASAKIGASIIDSLVKSKEPANNLVQPSLEFFSQLDDQLLAVVHQTIQLTPTIQEVIIRAPLAAKNFEPGQFYKFQNYHSDAHKIDGVAFDIEPLALTGAWVDKDKGLISLIILHFGASSRFCQTLSIGQAVVLMGPTGTPTHIPQNKNVMLVGGGLGNAVLFSIASAMKKNNCRILYFAGYRAAGDVFKASEIETVADIVVWCCDEKILPTTRLADYSFKANIIEGIKSYYDQPDVAIKLESIDHMVVIGSDSMMKAVAYARHNELKKMFNTNHIAIGSINSPMQCMMKEVCGQCIQRHIDPVTQGEYYVYSCTDQDQELDRVDFNHLNSRLKQNSLQEKVCNAISNKLLNLH